MADLPALSPWQNKIDASPKKDYILYGGRRTGKSFYCWRKGVIYGVNGYTTAWFCANKELANENWADIAQFCRPFATRLNEVSEGVISFEHPTRGVGYFKRRSGWNITSGRAGKIHFLILDEAQTLTKKLFNRTRPSLLTTHGHTAMTLTPPDDPDQFRESYWLKEIIDASDDEGNCFKPGWQDWYVAKHPTSPEDIAFVMWQDDLHFGITGRPASYYINLATDSLNADRELMGDDDFNREYMLYWGLMSDQLVYNNFRDGFHCQETYEYMPDAEVYWCADRGEGLAYSVIEMYNRIPDKKIGEIQTWRYRFFDEVATRTMISEDELMGNAIELSKKNHYRLPRYVFYDPRAARLGRAAFACGLPSYSCNVKVEEGIRVIRRLFNRDLFEMNPRCKLLHQNLLNYRRDAAGYPVDDNNDALDSARYGTSMNEKLDGMLNPVAADNIQMVAEMGGVESGAFLLYL